MFVIYELGCGVVSCCVCCVNVLLIFFFKQKTAYEMRISDWSSDVCSSDLSPKPQNRKIPSQDAFATSTSSTASAAAHASLPSINNVKQQPSTDRKSVV